VGRSLALFAIGLLVCGACAGEPEESPKPHEALPAAAVNPGDSGQQARAPSADSLRDDLVENGLLVPETHVAALSKLGHPDSVRSRPEQNRHNPSQTDSIIDLYYPGLHLEYHVVSEGGKELLTTAEVSDNRYLRYPELGIGASGSRIVSALGEPDERSGSKYEYQCARCLGYEAPLYFHLVDNVVKSLEYQFPLD